MLRLILVLVLCCCLLPAAKAVELVYGGMGSGINAGNSGLVSFNGNIINLSKARSDKIYIKVRANVQDSPTASGYTIAEGYLSDIFSTDSNYLEANEDHIILGWLPYKAPPQGRYYIYHYAFEYPDLINPKAYVRMPLPYDLGTAAGGNGGTAPQESGTGGSGTNNAALDLVCNCAFNISNNQVKLTAASIQNRLGRSTGPLKLKLWASTTPYSGSGSIAGYELGVYSFSGVLGNNTSFQNISQTVAFTAPPAGTWYLTMTLTENRNGEDLVMDSSSFSETLTISGDSSGSSGGSGTGTGGGTAAGFNLLCDCSYEVRDTVLDLRVNRVENSTGRTSGTLRLKVMASASPYNGGTLNGYQMAEYSFPGTLVDREYFYGIAQTVAYTPPPAGTWYVTLVLTEYNGSDGVVAHTNFSKTITVSSGSGSSASTKKPLDLECNCSYSVSGSNVSLLANKVTNNSTTTTGDIKLKLYATPAVYAGGTITGYQLAEYKFTQVLKTGQYYNNVNVTVPYTSTPGTWYYTLLLTQTVNGKETIADYAAFTTPVTVSGGGAAGTGSGTTSSPFMLDPWNGYKAILLPERTEHYYRIVVSEPGTLTIETSGSLDTVAKLAKGSSLLVTSDFGGSGNNFRLSTEVTPGTYDMQLYEFYGRSGYYSLQSSFERATSNV